MNARRFLAGGGRALAAAALLAGAVLATAQTAAPWSPPRDAANASYWWRVDNTPANPIDPPLDWYRPQRVVESTPGPFLPEAAAGRTTISAQALDEAAQFAQANGSSAFIVVHKGVVQTERYFGGGDAATRLSSHSFIKTLMAMAVGAAVADGKIASIDEPASRWLPEWRDAARERITLRQLLSMSAGFRTPFDTDPTHRFMWMHYGSDVETIVRTAQPAYAPDSDFSYDNDNLHPLALVLERATGEPYERFVARRVWQPIGGGTLAWLMDREDGRVMSYCCGVATARDWVRVGQTLLDGGVWRGQRVLPQAWVDEMRKPSKANPAFGLQLFLGAAWMEPRINRSVAAQAGTLAPALAPDLFYVSGVGGYQIALMPSQQLLVLRIGKPVPGWRDHVLPNLMYAAASGRSASTDWLLPWRLATRPKPGTPMVYDPAQPTFWPTERVAGAAAAAPLTRRAASCLDPARLQPALAEADRTQTSALLVWRNGAVEFERYAAGAGPEQRRETASMHKSVLGLLVGQALADGTLPGLDAPVSRWLPEWAGDERGRITLGQLLQMASGLVPMSFSMAADAPFTRLMIGPESAAAALQAQRAGPPGEPFAYSNANSQLLALVLERASGKRYAELLSQRLWQPLGAAEARVVLDRPGGLARGSGTLLARPEDWLRLGILFADRGRLDGRQVVPAAWIERMSAPSPANPNYGLHLWRASPYNPSRRYVADSPFVVPAKAPFAAPDMVFFDGAGGQRVYASPAQRLVIVRIGADAFDWDDSLLPNAVVEAARGCPAGGP